MAAKARSASEIVETLRQIGAMVERGRSVGESLKTLRIPQASYYRWRSEYAGLARLLREPCQSTFARSNSEGDSE